MNKKLLLSIVSGCLLSINCNSTHGMSPQEHKEQARKKLEELRANPEWQAKHFNNISQQQQQNLLQQISQLTPQQQQLLQQIIEQQIQQSQNQPRPINTLPQRKQNNIQQPTSTIDNTQYSEENFLQTFSKKKAKATTINQQIDQYKSSPDLIKDVIEIVQFTQLCGTQQSFDLSYTPDTEQKYTFYKLFSSNDYLIIENENGDLSVLDKNHTYLYKAIAFLEKRKAMEIPTTKQVGENNAKAIKELFSISRWTDAYQKLRSEVYHYAITYYNTLDDFISPAIMDRLDQATEEN